MKKIIICILLISTVVLGGCGGGGGKNGSSQTISSISVTPGVAPVVINGGTQQFIATAFNASGQVVSTSFSWTTDAPSNVGTINSTGLFTAGNQIGTANVTCSAGGKSKTVQVKVGQLKDAAEQLVNDFISLGNNAQTITDSPIRELLDNTNNEVIPNIEYATEAFEDASYLGADVDSLARIFTSTNRNLTYLPISPQANLLTGTWNVTRDTWHITYTRTTQGIMDEVTFNITNTEDTELRYQGKIKYQTAVLLHIIDTINNSPDSYILEIDATLVNKFINTSTVKGNININESSKTLNFDGILDFKFRNLSNNYLKYTGNLSVNHQVGQEDRLEGTLETANIKFYGSININYVTNNNSPFIDKVYPSLVELVGSAENKNDLIKLEGRISINIHNAASYNENLVFSSTNYIDGSVTFEGTVQANNSTKLEQTLIFEQIGWRLYKMSWEQTLTNGGVTRNLSVVIENTDAIHLHVVIDSSWGPAKFDMTLKVEKEIWTDENNIDLGDLTVNGVKKADIFREGDGIKIVFTTGGFIEIL